nr:homeotic protein female sterile-like [Danio rerio]|eukprot:XP_021333775.1 homeotic protein female sterile-like [Danio rerio]
MGYGRSVQERRIILIGKQGDGKSSAKNTIEDHAKELADSLLLNHRKITVIDAPDFFDTDHDEKTKSVIIQSLVDSAEGVDAIVVVLKVEAYVTHEDKIVRQILDTLKEDALKHTVILFTSGEELNGEVIEEFVYCSLQMQELVDKCGGRCHVIDSKHWNDRNTGYRSNREQVKSLLDTIDKMVKENGRYTNKLMEEQIQEQMKNNKKPAQSTDFMHNKTVEKVAGTASGVLTGAIMGLGVVAAAILGFLKSSEYELLKALFGGAGEGATAGGGGGGAAATGGATAAGGGATAAGGGATAEGEAAAAAVTEVAAEETGAMAEAVGAAEVGVAGEVAAGAAAAEVGVAGGIAAEAGAVAAEVGVAGGLAAEAGAIAAEVGVVGGAAAAEAGGIAAGPVAAAVVAEVAVVAGGIGGGFTGYEAAEDADSVGDAICRAELLFPGLKPGGRRQLLSVSQVH